MAIYHTEFTYEVEVEADSKATALEIAENTLSNAINGEGTNCFESETTKLLD